MQVGHNHASILETARALFERNPGGFSVASVCRETGVSRARLRRHFPTKKDLIASLNDAALPEKPPAPEATGHAQKTGTLDGRTSACEQALALLEAKAEVVEHELPPVTELPPIVTEEMPVAAARPIETPAARSMFRVREAAQQILAKAEEARLATPQSKWAIPAVPRLAAVAGLVFVALIAGTSLVSFGGFARAIQPPRTPIPEKYAIAAPEILIIDATGAAPDPMYQETPPALRDVVVHARRGETRAQVQLAQAFLKGDGFAADPIAAARWSDEAAAQGDATAQFILGTLYSEGIKPNARLAFDWFSAAASRGNVKAMHNLAIAYLNGTGVAQDSKAAAAWFEKAASAGYRDSAFDLAVLYERGEGVDQNSLEALKWYDQAASFGDPEAMQRATYLRSWEIAKR